MGFGRNLAPWEITAQLRELQMLDMKPTNVVFMGMGEPLHNWDSVDVALTQLNSPKAFGIGARHITVSTIGLLPQLAKFARREEQFRLAISLHSADSETRLVDPELCLEIGWAQSGQSRLLAQAQLLVQRSLQRDRSLARR